MSFDALRQEIAQAVEAELERVGQEIVRDIVLRIEQEGLEMDGTLKKSVTYRVWREAERYLLEVGAYARHAPFIKLGTRPHWAPIEPLRYWVRKKLAVRPPALEGVARAVQHAIARKGTRPHPFAGPVFELWRAKVADEIAAGLARRLRP